MRKRRRLANKMTIMVCAVLLAVSAFFYAPMNVNAVELTDYEYSFSDSFTTNLIYGPMFFSRVISDFSFDTDFLNSLDDNVYYRVNMDYSVNLKFISPYTFQTSHSFLVNKNSLNSILYMRADGNPGSDKSWVGNTVFVDKGSNIKSGYYFMYHFMCSYDVPDLTISTSFDYSINDCLALTGDESASYQQGYNAGYSAGEQAGESNGYSSGYSDGYEAGEQSGYDTGFQAGKDSVDTQLYYDAGYSAGYDVGYSTGYDTGYDEGYDAGWSAYEAQMDKWGADTSDYPLEISSGNTNAYFSVHVGSDIPFNYRDSDHWFSSKDYNPNHTYKYVINFSNIDEGLDSDILYDYWDIYLNIGGIEYNITPFQDMSVSVFIPGDRISTSYSFDWVLYNCANYVADDSNLAYLYVDYDFVIYDMGPSGDTQNHIANQTDQLTNGYDDSKGNTVNSNLSTGLNDYETAENSLFATATTGMRDFTFFDFESVPAMITGMSFIGSIMGSWFNQAGGASGVGIVLSILFSVILVAMVLGLYRWYQSKGGKD